MGSVFYLITLILSFFSQPAWPNQCADLMDDKFLWLEDMQSPQASTWVKRHNEKTLAELKRSPYFEKVKEEFLKSFNSPHRVPWADKVNGLFYNFWQDSTHVKGIWRRTTPQSYKSENPQWETLLDLDELSRVEQTNWVFHGSTPFDEGKSGRTLLALSPGGGDKVVVREFDLNKKAFVKDGFYIPEAKNDFSWFDENTLLVATEWGEKSLTKPGYPRQIRLWKRGTPLNDAKLLLEVAYKDVSATIQSFETLSGNFHFLSQATDFFHADTFWVGPDLKAISLPIPNFVSVAEIFNDLILLHVHEDWELPTGKNFRAGSLVSLPRAALQDLEHFTDKAELVYQPSHDSSLEGIAVSKDFLFLTLLKNVQGQILQMSLVNKEWRTDKLNFSLGMPDVVQTSYAHNQVTLSYEDFLTPSSRLEYDAETRAAPTVLKQAPLEFAADQFEVNQRFSTSLDGTKIPYFIIHKKGLVLDGKNPTLLYGYGGFLASMTPFYMGHLGKVWLEEGGVYVLSNIRGGAEFGPAWHEAALLEKRQNAYDDFASVAQHLIETKITSPENLGVMGGSNGGLLVGVFYNQHPELCNAVVCEVPLLDLMRYLELFAGDSWKAELGDPNDEQMRHVIGRYSPYHNVGTNVDAPSIFIQSSSTDDRVHPGHARKMTALLESKDYPVYFYENDEGGHSGSADVNKRAENEALTYTYLLQKLKR